MSLIKARIAALEAEVKAIRERNVPYEEMDPLSQSVVAYANELAALDDRGKAELLEEMTREGAEMEMADLEQMIRSITVDY